MSTSNIPKFCHGPSSLDRGSLFDGSKNTYVTAEDPLPSATTNDR